MRALSVLACFFCPLFLFQRNRAVQCATRRSNPCHYRNAQRVMTLYVVSQDCEVCHGLLSGVFPSVIVFLCSVYCLVPNGLVEKEAEGREAMRTGALRALSVVGKAAFIS
jgi:hypothetical protein